MKIVIETLEEIKHIVSARIDLVGEAEASKKTAIELIEKAIEIYKDCESKGENHS